MEKVLVSACLMGHACRYDGQSCQVDTVDVGSAEAVPFCPEQAGGLPTPREPAEIVGGHGDDVIDSSAQVLTKHGVNVTQQYVKGAHAALGLCQEHGIRRAVLKGRSPSCGVSIIYDGTFSSTVRPGPGVTAALLRRHGISVEEVG
ncbi:MAG: DUF523 domain-containing protein [Limnochordia bacterium]|jgi:uncharacterized protein YbbK (DUF523 family)